MSLFKTFLKSEIINKCEKATENWATKIAVYTLLLSIPTYAILVTLSALKVIEWWTLWIPAAILLFSIFVALITSAITFCSQNNTKHPIENETDKIDQFAKRMSELNLKSKE